MSSCEWVHHYTNCAILRQDWMSFLWPMHCWCNIFKNRSYKTFFYFFSNFWLCNELYATQKRDLACQERKWGGTSANRDENGQWMCNVKVKDRVPSKELKERLWIDDIILILQQNRLRWYGHVLRKEDTDLVKKCMEYEVEGSRPKGRPKRTLKEVVQKIARHVIWTRRMLWIVVDGRSW